MENVTLIYFKRYIFSEPFKNMLHHKIFLKVTFSQLIRVSPF